MKGGTTARRTNEQLSIKIFSYIEELTMTTKIINKILESKKGEKLNNICQRHFTEQEIIK